MIKRTKKIIKKVLRKMGIYKAKPKQTTNKTAPKTAVEKKPFIEIGDNWNDKTKPVAFMFGFNPWKREYMSHFFPEHRTAFVFGSVGVKRLSKYLQEQKDYEFVIWGYKEADEINKFALENQVQVTRVEDGFLRSLDLGAKHSLPLSIVIDKKGLYFNPQQSSDLEEILSKHDFSSNKKLLIEAKKNIDMIIEQGISKYNHVKEKDITKIYGVKTKKRILVIGQVEDDASIKYGLEKSMTNNELVWAAYMENPDAEIIYKPHPDVLEGLREKKSDPKEVEHIAKVVTTSLSVPDALKTIDHVYTFTSLSGFEALIRGIKVTCFGMPFYAGWGLTDDRQKCDRRKRKLSIEELFAGSYMLYPKYFNPITHDGDTCERIIKYLSLQKEVKFLPQKSEVKKPFIEIGSNWNDNNKPVAFMIGFDTRAREQISKFFPEYRVAFLYGKATIQRLKPFFKDISKYVFIVWQNNHTDEWIEYSKQEKIEFIRVDRGFLHSGVYKPNNLKPDSIVLDSKGNHYNSNEGSSLEDILQHYEFAKEPNLIKNAKIKVDEMIENRISNDNHILNKDIYTIYGEKTRKRILVIGQDETDANINEKDIENLNNYLVIQAYKENPGAQIIYKPHSHVLNSQEPITYDPMAVSDISLVLTEPVNIVDALETIDHVYVFNSIDGFEALIRDIKVTCIGLPFYAGWGLTDDRQVSERRTRKLSLYEIFAAVYILYPRYINNKNGLQTSFNHYLELVRSDLAEKSFRTGRHYFKNKNKELAKRYIDLAIKQYKNYTYYFTLAKIYADEKDFPKAIQLCKEAITICKGNEELSKGYYQLASMRKTSGDYSEEVIDLLYKSLSYKQNLPALNLLINFLYEIKGPTKEVLELIKMVIKIDPKITANKLISYAVIRNDAGMQLLALDTYKQAVKKDKNVAENKEYLGLTAMITEKEPELVGSSIELTNLYKSLQSYEYEFEKMVKSAAGSICIVGNSPIELGTGNGELIDSHKVVIRFNNYSVNFEHAKDYGSKVNVWVKAGFYSEVKRRNMDELDLVIVSGPNPLHRSRYGADLLGEFVKNGKNISVIPHQIFSEVVSKIKSPPSAGILMVYWLYKLTGPLKRSSVFGFSFVDQLSNKNSHYFSDTSSSSFYRHNWKAERALFDTLFEDSIEKSGYLEAAVTKEG